MRVLACEENSFKNNEQVQITFYKNYLKDDSGAVIEMNSGKLDLREHEGKSGVAKIELRNVNDKWTPKLVEFMEGQTIDAPEGEIL